MQPPAPWKSLALLLAVTVIAMFPLLHADFTVWDDQQTIVRNPNVSPSSLDGLIRIWIQPQVDLYVPVTYTFWSVLSCISLHDANGIARPSPVLFHTANLILHALSTLAVFALVSRLVSNSLAALIGAGIFALHPIQVEAVGWASGTKDLLCTLFCAIALWQYVCYVQRCRVDQRLTRASAIHYALATVALMIALLSKPTAVALPLAAGVLDLIALRRPFRVVVKSLALWCVLAAPIAVVAKVVQPSATFEHASLVARPLIALDAIGFYLRKFIFPAGFVVDYGRTPAFVLSHSTWIITGAVATGVGIWLWLLRKRSPFAVAGAGVGAAFLFPVLGFSPFHFQRFSTTADHYVYPAMIGVALAVAALLQAPSRRWILMATVVFLPLLAIRTFQQSTTWTNTRTLFQHVLTVNPRSAAAYNNLASFEAERGNGREAERLARTALELDPKSPNALTTLGAALAMQDKMEEAMDAARRAAAFGRDSAPALTNLAGSLAERRQFQPAADLLRQAITADPDFAPARANFGTLLAETRHLPEAIEQLTLAVKLDPYNAQTRLNFGIVLAGSGRIPEARRQLQTAIRLDPSNAVVRNMLNQLSVPASQPDQ